MISEDERLALLSRQSLAEERKTLERKAIEVITQSSKITRGSYQERLLQAGFAISEEAWWVLSIVLSSVVALVCGLLTGAWAGAACGVVLLWYFLHGLLEERRLARQRQVIPQLAPLIESIIASLLAGTNLSGALQRSSECLAEGVLQYELSRISRALQQGFSLDSACDMLRQRIPGSEIVLLTVTLKMFSHEGGSSVDALRQLSARIRSQEQLMIRAERDMFMVQQVFFAAVLGAPLWLIWTFVSQVGTYSAIYHSQVASLIFQFGVVVFVSAVLFFRRIMMVRL